MKKSASKRKKSVTPESSGSSLKTEAKYILKLYVTATTPRSILAVSNIRRLCEEHMPGRFELEVIDISKHPEIAKKEQLIGAPTLIKLLPLPIRRFIGDMSNTEKLIVGLNVTEA
jgi:circadian clock protein KaiB